MKTIIIDEKTVSVDGVIFERKEPEFKVGQWVIGIECQPRHPVLINRIEGKRLYSDGYTDNSTWHLYEGGGKMFIRPATHFEIEQHLIKVAKEKGFKEGITVKPQRCFARVLDSNEFKYIFDWQIDEDALACGNDIIWRAKTGWAEIIPTKKPLPKTQNELKEFLKRYISSPYSVDQFLEDYE